jgi:hypothetical protein
MKFQALKLRAHAVKLRSGDYPGVKLMLVQLISGLGEGENLSGLTNSTVQTREIGGQSGTGVEMGIGSYNRKFRDSYPQALSTGGEDIGKPII